MSAWEVFWKDEVSQFQFEGKVFRSNRDVFHFLARNNKIYCKSYLICEHFCLGIAVCEKHIGRKDNSIRCEASEDGRQLEMTTFGVGSTVVLMDCRIGQDVQKAKDEKENIDAHASTATTMT
jgi:hypothetical protein